MKDIFEFFYDNGQIMADNIYLFVMWTIICVGSTIAIMEKRNARKSEEMQEENKRLQQENDFLHQQYREVDEMPRLLMGKQTTSVLSAEAVSRRFNQSKKKQRNKRSGTKHEC